MTTILITGGAGFIAGALAERLAAMPSLKIVIVDNFVTGVKENIPSSVFDNIQFFEGDVNERTTLALLFERFDFDYVFHYAALVGVQRTQEYPIQVLKDVEGIKHLLEFAVQAKVKRFFYSSSSEVYGEPVHIPQHELTTPLNSRLPYAIVKNLGEAYLKAYHQQFDLPFTVFRFFNTYGPRQSQDFVIARFVKAALCNAPIFIYGDGLQTRTFCYIDDNVEASVLAFERDLWVNEVVNIGSEHEVTIVDLARTIVRLSQSSSSIQHLPPLKDGDMTRRQPDNTKMKHLLQRDLLPLEVGLQKVIQAYR
jgi:UDP-glucuronate decarboxylase